MACPVLQQTVPPPPIPLAASLLVRSRVLPNKAASYAGYIPARSCDRAVQRNRYRGRNPRTRERGKTHRVELSRLTEIISLPTRIAENKTLFCLGQKAATLEHEGHLLSKRDRCVNPETVAKFPHCNPERVCLLFKSG